MNIGKHILWIFKLFLLWKWRNWICSVKSHGCLSAGKGSKGGGSRSFCPWRFVTWPLLIRRTVPALWSVCASCSYSFGCPTACRPYAAAGFRTISVQSSVMNRADQAVSTGRSHVPFVESVFGVVFDWVRYEHPYQQVAPKKIWVAKTQEPQGLIVTSNYYVLRWGRERCDRDGHAVFLLLWVVLVTTGSESTGISTSSMKLK